MTDSTNKDANILRIIGQEEFSHILLSRTIGSNKIRIISSNRIWILISLFLLKLNLKGKRSPF
jgi:hypothetical protein